MEVTLVIVDQLTNENFVGQECIDQKVSALNSVQYADSVKELSHLSPSEC